MPYITQNACDKTNTLPKRKNSAAYALICMHFLLWGIVLKISNEIVKKKSKQRYSERKATTKTRKDGIRQWMTRQKYI